MQQEKGAEEDSRESRDTQVADRLRAFDSGFDVAFVMYFQVLR
jgi:hypothetical protein